MRACTKISATETITTTPDTARWTLGPRSPRGTKGNG
jgi:hypothetical protein